MAASPRVVVIGAGIVGCALADELTERGWTDVTVVEQGPLFETGGSSSHAPGLVFQTTGDQTMTRFARYTVEKYRGLADRTSTVGARCFRSVGGLEVARTPGRWADLRRRHGWATSWGVPSMLVDAEEAARLHPLLDPDRILGALHIPSDGLAAPVAAARAQAERAASRGARLLAGRRVIGVDRAGGRVSAVRTEDERFRADVVVCCAGMWGPRVGALLDLRIPLTPMAHQYARTTALPVLGEAAGRPDSGAGLPILRHQEAGLYFRPHGDRLGIGAYGHRPMPISAWEIADERYPVRGDLAAEDRPLTRLPSVLEFTAEDFESSWSAAQDLLPVLGDAKVDEGINGLFSFTADGMPLLGEHPDLEGCWFAEAVWITHSAGVARAVAEWLVDGQPSLDLHGCDLNRFERVQTTPDYVRVRSARSFAEVYDVVHPHRPIEAPRALRTSPFYERQQRLGARFAEVRGWERPQWYAENENLPELAEVAAPGEWAARHWSRTVGAEALHARRRAALFDMTPLTRLEVTGPGAADFLQAMTSNDVVRRLGSVTYTLLLGEDGGIRSDLTVARLGEERFQLGANGPLDVDWLRRHLPGDGSAQVRDITAGTCCLGLWGPHAREVLSGLTDDDVSHRGLRYYRARDIHVGGVPVTAMRLSYVGELGWELYTTADLGRLLWDTLWDAGRPHGLIAAGRGAFDSMRLEKGYRSWGLDMTTEHAPDEAGVDFAVRLDKGYFVGRDAIEARRATSPTRRLCALVSPEPAATVVGAEPVFVAGRPLGYVTSAGFGHTLRLAVAYAWLPAEHAVPGVPVEIEYFGERLPYTVAAEPLFDPEGSRMRR
ncbi:glycine cleavage system aminomethyltransferase T/glycine/D-amino acid oxidase-like deaminating enzyme [Actinoalloteichus hoggarensis]|uniref:4-methylaminobutanoate oxidase (Formaldehyde-forming) n=1 Tax=Actinoalloteichus hoggarensis TaxID=1470176 RepID=A0A221VZG8_9PSEU|nr:FAD-dependent oxidoreductase [Actinoalloteichus hoggarensis]ASO18915.1 4-methylaminobutanoate oxidase (formaldehyde-forming) [Actinoalloteichus hoggarensis]MBB5920150.1 glycine cleavage system aminomethyltransferase T/glycine/D-amino acid oxidase-like deaminating enzyme [Actinoalloteichus hoggarensis]